MGNYKNNLKEKLPANNSDSDVVLNSFFNEWSEHIALNLNSGTRHGDDRYSKPNSRNLLHLCRKHAAKYGLPKNSGSTIMLTHPFYLPLTHMGYIASDSVNQEVNDYIDALMGLLSANKEKKKADVVVLETIHHYAAATSLLMENGLVGRIIFTEYDSGEPLDADELKAFGKDAIFFGGGYIGRCLASSIKEMRHKSNDCDRLRVITDLSLYSPQDRKSSLKPEASSFFSSRIADVKKISLEETIRLLKLS